MKKWRKVLSISLVVLLLFSSASVISAAKKKEELATILMVPLDDRPANIYFSSQVGFSAGVEVITPPKEMIGVFTTPGNSEDIEKWLLENGDQAEHVKLPWPRIFEAELEPELELE